MKIIYKLFKVFLNPEYSKNRIVSFYEELFNPKILDKKL